MNEMLIEKFSTIFEKELLEELGSIGKIVHLAAGETIIDTGQYIKSIPILLSGNIKIIRQDDEGGEILLYYVGSNETCAMSLTCCMAHQKSRIKAVAEEATSMITIPISKMEEWMIKYPSWKNFVMQTYSARFDELLKTIDSIAFHKVDERLEKYLKDRKGRLMEDPGHYCKIATALTETIKIQAKIDTLFTWVEKKTI